MSAREVALAWVDRALASPAVFLGSVERNTEIKVALFILCALGWDVVEDIAFACQISRKRVGVIAKAAFAADFLLRDAVGACAIGEAKQWGAGDAEWKEGIDQVRRYQAALHTPRAFLTTGQRWLVLGKPGEQLADVSLGDLPTRFRARALVDRLAPALGKGKVVDQNPDPTIWGYGVWPGGAGKLLLADPLKARDLWKPCSRTRPTCSAMLPR